MGKDSRKLIGWIFIILGIISIAYFISLNFFGGAVSFAFVWLIMGILSIGFGLDRLNPNLSVLDKISHKLSIGLLVVVILGMIILAVLEGIIIHSANKYDNNVPDYAIILGAGLQGREMSKSLLYRMEEGLKFAKSNPEVKIIVSGGQGKGEDITEASAMKQYLLEHGINEARIIVEDKSTNTVENFKFSKDKLKEIDNRDDIKLTVITNGFHMFRSKMLGERCGFEIYRQPADTYEPMIPNFYLREAFALIKSYFFDKVM